MEARSFDGAGATIDQGTAPGTAGTQQNPFKVAWDGSVDYLFTLPKPFVNNHWNVSVVLLGLALALFSILYGINALGAITPWAAFLLGLLIGIVLIFVPRPWGRHARPVTR